MQKTKRKGRGKNPTCRLDGDSGVKKGGVTRKKGSQSIFCEEKKSECTTKSKHKTVPPIIEPRRSGHKDEQGAQRSCRKGESQNKKTKEALKRGETVTGTNRERAALSRRGSPSETSEKDF